MADQINEGSTGYLTVTFLDKNGLAAAPVSATYRIHDVLSGTEIRAETAITPIAAQVEITLTPADNTLVNEVNSSEPRRVTAVAVYGQADGVKADFVYEVKNLARAG